MAHRVQPASSPPRPPPSRRPALCRAPQLAETGTPVEAIQLGRAADDDEDWLDLLDAEAGDPWMRDPHVSPCRQRCRRGGGAAGLARARGSAGGPHDRGACSSRLRCWGTHQSLEQDAAAACCVCLLLLALTTATPTTLAAAAALAAQMPEVVEELLGGDLGAALQQERQRRRQQQQQRAQPGDGSES